MNNLYPKIESPFQRHTIGELRNRPDPTRWSRPEFEVLADLQWHWSEKVDGTNVRIMWDGHKVTFGGRTENANMPVKLIEVLQDQFPEELMEQQFHGDKVMLCGEGVGANIQSGGGKFGLAPRFILFDVKVGDWWLMPDSVERVAQQMGLEVVPTVWVGTVAGAVTMVSAGLGSQFGDFMAEGVVGRAPWGLRARNGDRLMMKIKSVDFFRPTKL
jgi:hypothetical protein